MAKGTYERVTGNIEEKEECVAAEKGPVDYVAPKIPESNIIFKKDAYSSTISGLKVKDGQVAYFDKFGGETYEVLLTLPNGELNFNGMALQEVSLGYKPVHSLTALKKAALISYRNKLTLRGEKVCQELGIPVASKKQTDKPAL